MDLSKYNDSVYGKSAIEDIKDIEREIVKVRILDQDKADEFSEQLEKIKKYANEADLGSRGASEDAVELINQIASLQFDIMSWRKNEGREIQNAKILSDIGYDILDVLEKGRTDRNYFMEGLTKVREKWNSKSLSYVQKYNLDQQLSNALEKVIELKIKMDEPIYLTDIDKICSRADLVDRMKEAISKKADDKSSNINFGELLDSLNESNFTDTKYWQVLTGEESIRFIEEKEENKKDECTSYEDKPVALNGLFSKYKKIAFHYGIIDEKTGEYIVKYTLYKDCSKKPLKRLPLKHLQYQLIGIDIDDERIEEASSEASNILNDSNENDILVWNLTRFFRDYGSLKFVNIGNSIKKIPDYFFKSSNIETITLGENVEVIGVKAFYFSDCKKVTMSDKVKEIKSNSTDESKWFLGNDDCSGAFEGCTKLTEIRLSNSLVSIPVNCFAFCRELRKIDIPDSVIIIKEGAFVLCENLRDVNIGRGTEVIEEGAFTSTLIYEVNIPKNVRLIRGKAFNKYVLFNYEDEEHKPKFDINKRKKKYIESKDVELQNGDKKYKDSESKSKKSDTKEIVDFNSQSDYEPFDNQ